MTDHIEQVQPISDEDIAELTAANEALTRALFVDPNAVVTEPQVRAVADASSRALIKAMGERIALQSEVERLRAWREEATRVMSGLQDLGQALGLPLGERITGRAAVEAARRLRKEAEEARTHAAAIVAILVARGSTGILGPTILALVARMRAAEAELDTEREQVHRYRRISMEMAKASRRDATAAKAEVVRLRARVADLEAEAREVAELDDREGDRG